MTGYANKYPADAADFASDMNKIDPNWLISRSRQEWSRYLGISVSNFASIKSGFNCYTNKRRALLKSMAEHEDDSKERQRQIDMKKGNIHPEKLDDYILQQDVNGRYVLTKIVATFRDRQEADLYSLYINKRTV